jgi:hypothetical protein
MMILAEAASYQEIKLGFLALLLLALQTWYQDWRAKRNAATIKSEVVVAAKEVKKTAEEAAGTAEAGNKKLDKVYDAVNGKGLMGVLSRVERKVDEQGKALIDHIKDDAIFQGKLSEQFSSLETFIKGSPLPPAGGEMTVELHGTATMNKEAT